MPSDNTDETESQEKRSEDVSRRTILQGAAGIGAASAFGGGAIEEVRAAAAARFDEAEGTQQVYIVFDQYDESLSGDRAERIRLLREHAEASQEPARTTLAEFDNVDLVRSYWITNVIRAEVDADAVTADQLQSLEGVRAVYLVPEYRVPEPESADTAPEADGTTYGLEQINAPDVWDDFSTQGEGVKVAVLDTGFDVSHPDLELYSDDSDDPTYPGGWVEIGPDGEPIEGSEPYDSHYHGTHVGGTVGASAPDGDTPQYGVAPGCDLMHGLVLPGGSGADSDPIAGFEYVLEEMGADVISMSFGAGCGLFGPVYEDAWIPVIQNALAMDVLAVTSSGNSGEGCVGSPANIYDSFAIGASDENGDITEFSSGDTIAADNWEEPDPDWPDEWIKPDVSAPGNEVLSAEPGGTYQNLSGTSMAAPHVAGVLALMLSANEDLTAVDSRSVLEGTAWKPDDWSEPGDEQDVRYGYGIVDAYAAVDEVGAAVYEYDLGDVNQDDSVNVQDVQLTQQYIYGMDPENFNEDLGDLNRDGEVDTTDLNLLQYKVQGNLDLGAIDVSNLEGPDEADQGTEIELSADLENTGEEGAIEELAVHMAETEDDLGSGEPVTTTFVDLAAPGVSDPVGHPAETTVTLTVDTSGFEPGEYYYGLYAEDDSETGELTLVSSYFEVSNLDAPGEVDQGDEIEVSADITNTGNADDTQTVEYLFDEEVRRSTEVSLEPGGSQTVTFEDIDTSGTSEGTYDHGVSTDDDAQWAEITVLEPFFDVEITDAPETVTIGETYDVDATVENTGDAPDEQEIVYDLGAAGGDVAVVDVSADTSQGEGIVGVLDERLDNEAYAVDLVVADDLLDAMGDYDTFVIQRFGGDGLASDFLDALGDDQNAVYLDSYQGASAEAYADGIYRLHNVREDPATRGSEGIGTTGDPVTIDITADHAVFAGVGEEGDTVEVYTGSTTWGSWFNDYSGTLLADADFGGDFGGPSVAVGDDGEVLCTAVARDYFTNESDFTDAGNRLLTNAVEYATTGNVTTDTATVESSKVVELEPGESEALTFTDTVPEDATIGDAAHIVTSEDEQATAPVTVEIDGGTVEGTVTVAGSGDPIEGATIEIHADPGDHAATTDADGEYAIENVPAGEHEITVTAEDYAEVSETIEVPEDGAVTYDAALEPAPGSITGQVTASDDGEPVEGVTVVGENGDGDAYEATTDAEGQYALDVPAGTYVVTVAETPPGYQPEEIVTVTAGETVEGVDFQIDRSPGSIEGQVTNAAGVPIEGAEVVDADQEAFSATTDADGNYTIEGVTPGTKALRALHEDYPDSDITFVEVAPDETTSQNLTLGTYFEVSNLEAPGSAEQGETIDVSADVTNTGDQEDTRTVFYFPPGTDFGTQVLDYEPEQSKTVTLDGGETTTVEFSYEIPADEETGDLQHGVSADEIATATITIEEGGEPDPAYFEVSSIDGPDTVDAGESFTADATITNTGDQEATQTIYLFWDGEVDARERYSEEELRRLVATDAMQEVTLTGGDSTTVSLTHTLEDDLEPATYAYSISTLQEMASAEITVEAVESIGPARTDGSGFAGISSWFRR
ncbi:S8 family serine peptidase [Saliphagus infecundisoli]|uniref:S8 family serine peptidase n=1 Tax=Saliphagus infecundisoli TaxID=1849069 RepID=A0ABD5QAS4_9EURY|nr:S8 family serine peptidase [Saliphagus infecundisoli]